MKQNNPSSELAVADIAGPLQNLIAGEWQTPGVELDQPICNSNTGEVICQQSGSTPEQVAAALDAADKAHRDAVWSGLSPAERAAHLNDIASGLDAVAADIAAVDAMTTGVSIGLTQILATVCGAAFRNAAQLTQEPTVRRMEATFVLERLPLGPAAIIGPWNAPAGIACHKLASALAAGCPVVFKPSEWAPHSAQIIASVIQNLDLPDGVFNMVHGAGEVGAQIVEDERIAAVSLTGGLESGRAVARTCAEQIKPTQLELGGNNPLIVLPDASLEDAAAGVVTAMTTLNGQWCRALGRLLVHESIAGEFLDAVLQRLAAVNIGASTDADIDMGPMVHQKHLQHVRAAIEKYEQLGGTAHASSKLPDLPGWFIAPTLVTGVASEDALHEIFGPVATVHEFSDTDEAIKIANQAPFGLSAYVFGSRESAIDLARHLETGMVKVNSVTLFSPHPELPRAAWKLSGLGEEGSRETFEFFRGTRVIGFPEAEV